LAAKTKRDEVMVCAFRPPVPAEVLLQRCELDSRRFAAVLALDISPPLFLPCSSYYPKKVEGVKTIPRPLPICALNAPLMFLFVLFDGGLMERRASILRLAAQIRELRCC
jgi:hypothetical protein